MKILLATTAATLNGGGIGSYNVEFCDAFRECFVLHLLTREPFLEIDGYEKVFSLGLHPLRGYIDYKNLIDTINKEGYDVVFNSDSSVLAVIAPFLKVPIVSVSHTYNNLPAIRAGFNHRYIAKIIALSKAGKSYLESKFQIENSEKVIYLYNFVHHEKKSAPSNKETRKILNIVYPGGAIPMKSPDMVVEALNRLTRTDINFNFYWFGNDIVPLKKFSFPKTIADLISADKRIKILGKVSRMEARKIIDSANIFVLPSRAEGCPVSLMEAMCTGCIPIVGSGKHVCREILEDGDFGLIVEKNSSESLYRAFIEVLSTPSKYSDSYKKTLEYSNRRLSESMWRKKMIDIFVNASNSKKEYLPISRFALLKSKLLFSLLAQEKVLEDKCLSLKVFLRFNYMYIKNRINGII